MNRAEAVTRIAQVNPKLVFVLADLEGGQFEAAVFEAVGTGREVASFKALRLRETLEAVREFLGPFEEEDRVRWRATRDTVVLRLTASGKNYRLWWWRHADDVDTGWEAVLYEEPVEVTALEMAFYL